MESSMNSFLKSKYIIPSDLAILLSEFIPRTEKHKFKQFPTHMYVNCSIMYKEIEKEISCTKNLKMSPKTGRAGQVGITSGEDPVFLDS